MRYLSRLELGLLLAVIAPLGCDDDNGPLGNGEDVSGRWVYTATELRGTEVTCSTSEVVLMLVRTPGSIRVDSRFNGSAFAFSMDCERGNQSARILFTSGTSVMNGEIEDGVVAFDFVDPDFIHTGTITDGTMSGIVATRLDLSQSPLSDAGVVNLIGEWVAVRD